MQPGVNSSFTGYLRCPHRVLHENHCADRRHALPSHAIGDTVGGLTLKPPIVSINDQSSAGFDFIPVLTHDGNIQVDAPRATFHLQLSSAERTNAIFPVDLRRYSPTHLRVRVPARPRMATPRHSSGTHSFAVLRQKHRPPTIGAWRPSRQQISIGCTNTSTCIPAPGSRQTAS